LKYGDGCNTKDICPAGIIAAGAQTFDNGKYTPEMQRGQ